MSALPTLRTTEKTTCEISHRKCTPDSLRLRSPSNNHFCLLKWTSSVLYVSCSHSAALKRKVAVSFAFGVSMDVKLRSRLSRRSRINERDPSFPSFTHVFKSRSFQDKTASIHKHTGDNCPGGNRATQPHGYAKSRDTSSTQRGTDGEDKGALTGSPLCHRRWHFSRPRSRSSVCSKRLPPQQK